MKPRDRFLAALHLEEPDRVPLFDIEINKPMLRRVLGREDCPWYLLSLFEVEETYTK